MLMLVVLVLTSPSYWMQSLPTVHHTWCGTAFSGQCAHMILRYVAVLPWGMVETRMKNMVLVPGVDGVPGPGGVFR